jgi:hypothetical protein
MTKGRGGLFLACMLAIALVPQPISAVAYGTTTSVETSNHEKPVKPKKPRPEVKGSWQKEAGRLVAETTMKSREHTPPRTTGGRRSVRSGQQPKAHRPQTLSEIQMETTDSQLHRLNDGICSRLPDGTIEGPSRCADWFDYLDSKNRRPTVEEAIDQVREQIQQQTVDIPFPKLSVRIQPTGRTLVNLDTIVYTDKRQRTTVNVSLLGYPVTLVGWPVSYTWHFGDGTPDLTTTSPGSPYPSKEITHKYLRRGAVKLSVTVNYNATFSVAGAGPQAIDGLLPVTGPVTPLQVREGVPVLVDPGR